MNGRTPAPDMPLVGHCPRPARAVPGGTRRAAATVPPGRAGARPRLPGTPSPRRGHPAPQRLRDVPSRRSPHEAAGAPHAWGTARHAGTDPVIGDLIFPHTHRATVSLDLAEFGPPHPEEESSASRYATRDPARSGDIHHWGRDNRVRPSRDGGTRPRTSPPAGRPTPTPPRLARGGGRRARPCDLTEDRKSVV